MDKIILSLAKRYSNFIHDSDFHKIATWDQRYKNPEREDWEINDFYFFFKQELDNEPVYGDKTPENRAKYAELKKSSIRHMFPHRKGFFDYTTRNFYDTLSEWAADNGKKVEDICYGRVNIYFVDKNMRWNSPFCKYITFNELAKFLDPNWESVQVVDLTTTDEDEPMTPETRETVDRVNGILDQINLLRLSVEALRPL
jgi:hypothetical protein